MKFNFDQLIKENESVHIYYNITHLQTYIKNTVSYIISGIHQGQHILIIESEKLIPHIFKALEGHITKDQQSYIHTVNNFDYYCSTGSFQPAVIFDHLSKTLKPFYDQHIPFRIWAHVEWSEQEGILTILEEFENEADKIVQDQKLYLVCAYDEERVPESLKTSLMKCHEYIMKDDEIIISELYQMNP
ncbi:MEDS domain-containing protein [Heyndrickxia acidicola]|uniref:MEDS domain-containing protein n=1 Tax=Heyndrickxia acidicola TaxID=209389 RepID=A0ABU6MIP2_9BACI|nr:MEDS domain-containing protein [Heyndrickxia acidicola]MED1203518.1 MEDS domain-containing protein [Heyndrickxia acidicola]